MRFFTFFTLIILFQASAQADVYQAALDDRCAQAASELIENGQVEIAPDEQFAVLCDAFKVITQKYIQTSLTNFIGEFEDNLDRCLGFVEDKSVDLWGMNTLLKACYAQFNDGHLEVIFKNLIPVFLPFEVKEVEGRFYVARTGYSICSDSDFKVGDEIISIGANTLSDTKETLEDYVAASTAGARKALAVKLLTKRDFAVPEDGPTQIVLSRDSQTQTFSKHWLFKRKTMSKEQEEALLNRGFTVCESNGAGVSAKGYSDKSNLYPERRSAVLYRESSLKTKVVTINRPKVAGDKICYLKIHTFTFNETYHKSGKVDVWDELEWFVEDCADENADLVLDLRNNKGGDMNNMKLLVQFLMSKKAESSANSIVYTRMELEGEDFGTCGRAEASAFAIDVHDEKLLVSWCALFSMKAKFDDGYPGKIYILSSEHCMSACDYMVEFLGAQKNSTVVGSATHGAMLLATGGALYNEQRRPYALKVYDVAPYYFVGVDEERDGGQRLVCSDDGGTCLVQFEGGGVVPSESYTTTYEDLVSFPPGAGWRARVENLIKTNRLKQVP